MEGQRAKLTLALADGWTWAKIASTLCTTNKTVAGNPPTLVIYDQPAHFAGTVRFSDGPLPASIEFEGNGLKEYIGVVAPTEQ